MTEYRLCKNRPESHQYPLEFTPNFYCLLLIDVNMPLMVGFQLVHNLNVRVCVMTSGEINLEAAREVHRTFNRFGVKEKSVGSLLVPM
jgi:FixJ family two-component response regulator